MTTQQQPTPTPTTYGDYHIVDGQLVDKSAPREDSVDPADANKKPAADPASAPAKPTARK